ncbi:TraR/DksA C4-type zinc finger protein [Acidimicrobiia bacterium EGI L10123]|uniref:TraR/DksA family transcriptional regulator n=1 Tax=Salinilacustrithrix flava TaxID=2957203 RepID=UPI003D7C1FFA|nr:TraR/DksA C4-type zinc finger protein [Acidimicrobiia bacterium EGI L10123]
MAARTDEKHRRRLRKERGELEGILEALQGQLRSLVDEGREVAESDFSEEGGDPDGGVVERDRVRARIADTEEHLRQVDRAEQAIEDGTYGTCRVCGTQVPEERLEALPWTTLCVQCKAAGHSA